VNTHIFRKKIKVGWARMSHQESVIVNDVPFLFKLSTCFEELGLCDTNTGLILFRLVHAESIHVLQRAQVGYGSTCNSQPSGCSVVLCIHISKYMSVIVCYDNVYFYV